MITKELIPMDEFIEEVLKNTKANSFLEYKTTQRYFDRELYLEDIDEESCKTVFRFIVDFNKEDKNTPIEERKPIILFINSDGGNVIEGYALMDAIELSKTPIHTICIGKAYSMGGLIFLSGHRRIMYPKASFMLHEGSTALIGDAGKVKDTMKFYEKLLKISEEFVLKKTKISPELYEQKETNDWYITAEECLSLGITDEIAKTLL